MFEPVVPPRCYTPCCHKESACYSSCCKFQDVISRFEEDYHRGGGATGARVRAERKLVILDKVRWYRMSPVADCAVPEMVKSLASHLGEPGLI
jgi:hypothetical protein